MTRDPKPSRTLAMGLALSTALCFLLAGCGAEPPADPGTPDSNPSTPPRAASLGHLHVVQGVSAMAYEIDGDGRLRPPVTQNLGAVQAVSNDPEGRFVFAAFGRWDTADNSSADQTLATFAAAPGDGALRLVSERTVWRSGARTWNDQDEAGWRWIAAGGQRLYGLRFGRNWRHFTHYFAAVALAATGELGAPVIREFDLDDEAPFHLLVDPRSDRVYLPTSLRNGSNGLVAHSIGLDGRLTQTGWSDLCGGAAVVWPATPLVAVQGAVLAHAHLARQEQALCSYEGAGLVPRGKLDFVAQKPTATFHPTTPNGRALVALSVAPSALRLLGPKSDGGFDLLDEQQLSAEARAIVFHPSGRFLYVSDAGPTLLGYEIGADGRLSRLDSLPHAGGTLALTLPPD